MATVVWSGALLAQSGEVNPVDRKTGVQRSSVVMLSCTGPASSVAAGAVIDVSSWLKSQCFGGRVIGRQGGNSAQYVHYVKPASAWAPATVKIVTQRVSDGANMTAGTNLSSEKLVVEFVGS